MRTIFVPIPRAARHRVRLLLLSIAHFFGLQLVIARQHTACACHQASMLCADYQLVIQFHSAEPLAFVHLVLSPSTPNSLYVVYSFFSAFHMCPVTVSLRCTIKNFEIPLMPFNAISLCSSTLLKHRLSKQGIERRLCSFLANYSY